MAKTKAEITDEIEQNDEVIAALKNRSAFLYSELDELRLQEYLAAHHLDIPLHVGTQLQVTQQSFDHNHCGNAILSVGTFMIVKGVGTYNSGLCWCEVADSRFSQNWMVEEIIQYKMMIKGVG